MGVRRSHMYPPQTEKRLYCMNETPSEFREPAILSGYRQPGLSIPDTLQSVFQLHNETFSIWTHLVAFFFFLGYFFYTNSYMDLFNDSRTEPLLCVFLTTLLYSAISAFAHTFRSISELSQHAVFILDFYAISLCAFGSSLATLAYGFPESWRGSHHEQYYFLLSFIFSAQAVFVSCSARLAELSLVTKLMKIFSFFPAYFNCTTPILYRVIYLPSNPATQMYSLHFVTLTIAAICYSTHIPEILFPGKFDIFFGSHQLFHVFTSISSYYQISATILDITENHTDSEMSHSFHLLLSAAVFNAVVAVYFLRKLYSAPTLSTDKLMKEQ